MHKEGLQRNPRSILARSCFPWTDDRKQSRWRCLSCMCRTRSHQSNVRIRILSLLAKLVDLSINQEKYPTFWLQPSVVYIKRWKTTTQADAPPKIQRMVTGIKFFFHLVAMERILVVFLRIQRKAMKEDASKGLRSNGATSLFTELWRKPQTNGFHDFILFCYR